MPAKKKATKRKRSKWMLDMDRREALIDALMAEFKTNLLYDYPIPDNSTVEYLIILAVYEFCGYDKKNAPRKPGYHGGGIYSRDLKNAKLIPKRMMDDLIGAVNHGKEERSWVDRQLFYEYKYGNEFFYGHGTYYRMRPSKKGEMLAEAKKQLTKKEMEIVKGLGKIMRKNLKPAKEEMAI